MLHGGSHEITQTRWLLAQITRAPYKEKKNKLVTIMVFAVEKSVADCERYHSLPEQVNYTWLLWNVDAILVSLVWYSLSLVWGLLWLSPSLRMSLLAHIECPL